MTSIVSQPTLRYTVPINLRCPAKKGILRVLGESPSVSITNNKLDKKIFKNWIDAVMDEIGKRKHKAIDDRT